MALRKIVTRRQLAVAEFFLAGGFEGVGGLWGWALGHPAFGVVAIFPGAIFFVPDVWQLYYRCG